VRERQIMDLEAAHWHLSTLPALAAGFRDRGFLQEGMPADIVVYDFDNLALLPHYRAYDYPAGEWRLARKADGYRWILVNGVVTSYPVSAAHRAFRSWPSSSSTAISSRRGVSTSTSPR